MRRRAGFLLASVLVWPSGAAALHQNYISLFKAAKESGRPALIVYTRPTNCPFATAARDFVLKNRTNVQFLAPRFEVAEIQIAVGGKRYYEYRKRFSGNFIPFWVVTTPDGEYIDGGDYSTIADKARSQWRRRVGKIASTHPRLSKKTRQKAAAALQQAQQDFEKGRCAESFQAAEKIYKTIWYPKELPEKANELLAKISQKARTALDEAEKLAQQEEFLAAALAWDEVVSSFSVRLPAGKTAAENLRRTLKAHKDIVPEFNRAKRNREAEKLLGRARELEKQGKSPQARSAYLSLQRQYADTPSAAKAKEALERLRPAVAEAPAEAPDQGASLLRLARNYYSAGMKAKARDKLLACIKAAPDSGAAKEARKLLTQWGLTAAE
jgi:hypothetical protein